MHRYVMRYVFTHRLQLTKFAFVGLATFGINFSCFHLFYGLIGLNYEAAVSIAYLVTVMSHFLLNRFFTFSAADQALVHHTWRYLLMLGLNYAISISIVWAAVELARVSPYLGIVASTGATACVSFLVMKHFVFEERKAA